ncbi:hypothetical protein JCM11491_002611 [Sporobolomyces phaffii]
MSRAGSSATSPDTRSPAPTLASLLVSTAESLAVRSDSLKHASTPAYLASLLAEPLPALEALPNQLGSASATLDADLSTLAFTRYPAFLLAHEKSLAISSHFDKVSTHLESLLAATTQLELAASKFDLEARDIRHHRAKLATVNDRLEPIEELLDAAKLVDGCVRSGQWTEAIKVSHRIHAIQARYHAERDASTGARGILDRVAREVEHSLMGLKLKVIESFGERGLKLPGAVRGVGILRKLHVFAARATDPRGYPADAPSDGRDNGDDEQDEEEGLRIMFLASRWRCFQQELKLVETQMTACGIPLADNDHSDDHVQRNKKANKGDAPIRVGVEENDERTRWIKRWIEVWREIVGDTVGMYSEVFLSHPPPNSSTSSAPRVDSFLNPRPRLGPNAPLELFLSTSLSSLSAMLERALPSLTSTASLSSLLTQLTYCAHSFSRHGLAFDVPLDLASVFSAAVERITLAEWELAGRAWESEWRQGWNKSGGTALVTSSSRQRRNGRTPIKDWLVVPEGTLNLLSTPLPPPPSTRPPTARAEDEEDETKWTHQPSPSLALLPPLAHFVNSHATALNALRLLPPTASYPALVAAQEKELDRASRVLEAFVDAWLASYHGSTPVPHPSSTFDVPGGEPGPGGSDGPLSEEENLVVRERDEEKRVVLTAIAWFGREVIPWLRDALVVGVYAELKDPQRRRRGRDAMKETQKRTEKLLARIQGKEWVDPDLPPPAAAKVETNGNGREGHGVGENGHDLEDDAQEKDLPVLEIPNGGPLDHLDNGEQEKQDATAEEPLDFTATEGGPSATDEPSLEPTSPTTRGDDDVEHEEETNVPYQVDDVAPPPPVPLAGTNGNSDSAEGEPNGVHEEERATP